MNNKYKYIVFQNTSNLLEAPGTLPDLPGWILGHPIEVEQKSKTCQTVEQIGKLVLRIMKM